MENIDTFPYKPCPFCGKNEQKVFSNYEACESDIADGNPESWLIVCDASSENSGKGCGSSSGYHGTKRLAADYWNQRSNGSD